MWRTERFQLSFELACDSVFNLNALPIIGCSRKFFGVLCTNLRHDRRSLLLAPTASEKPVETICNNCKLSFSRAALRHAIFTT
jgi:hypothetical protein